MAQIKQTPSAGSAGGLSRSVCTIRKVPCDFSDKGTFVKEMFSLAARAALIGCTLHRVQLGHVNLYRLQCLDGAMVLSHPHDVQAAITARGAA